MVTADGLPTAQINGVVWSQVIVGNTVFAGGDFTSVRPAGSAPKTNESPRSNLMSYNIVTGVATSFAPNVNGVIQGVAASADGKTLYIVGAFTTVNGAKRDRFAAIDIATQNLLPKPPDINGTVNAIALVGSTAYLGGFFSGVNGVTRTRLAAINVNTGALLSWAPTADYTVRALVATPDKTGIVAGGNFGFLNGVSARGMGLLDRTTGATKPWAANSVVRDYGTKSAILSLWADATTVYGSGYAFGQGNYEGVFALDPAKGAITWLQDCHGDTYSVVGVGDTIYSVGHAHFCGNIGGFPNTTPQIGHRALAVTRQVTGTVLTNGAPGAHHGNFVGYGAPSLYNWFPDLTAGTFTGQSQAAWTITGNSQYLALGGEFTQVNGKVQQGLVRMALPTLAPNKQGPVAAAADMAPTATAQQSSVLISWQANWDRDDQVLTYDVLRNGAVVKTFKATSQFWNRPTLSWSDPNGSPGVSYTYAVRVHDPSGNTVTSPTVAAVYPSDPAYAQLVEAGGATHQWRLGSPPGASSDPDSVGGLPLTVKSGVTFGVKGALPADADTAATFTGSAQTASTTVTSSASVEGWFKTTSTGALVGFGSVDRSQPSVAGDRQVYLTTSGKLAFAEHPGTGSTVTITSSSAYNDGKWHQLVATHSATSADLYVDGSRVATSASPAAVPTAGGVWTLGGATATDLPSSPTVNYNGTLDDVSVFGSALTARQVRDHFLTARPGYTIVDVGTKRG